MTEKINPATGKPITPIDPRNNLPIPPDRQPSWKEWDEVDDKGNKWHVIQTKSETIRQPIAPPSVNRPHPRLSFLGEAEEYLRSRGWEMTGVNEAGLSLWRDPMTNTGAKPEVKVMAKLPLKGGGLEDIKQLCIPALPWDYPMQEAMQIQWQRDESAKSLDQQIEQKKAELEALLKRKADQEAATVQGVS